MSKIKPDYWGNIIYETVMGLYLDENEAKEESWMQEHCFPLYDQETVNKLEEELSQYKKYFADNVMIPTEEYGAMIDELLATYGKALGTAYNPHELEAMKRRFPIAEKMKRAR